jgi:hypothetical protein
MLNRDRGTKKILNFERKDKVGQDALVVINADKVVDEREEVEDGVITRRDSKRSKNTTSIILLSPTHITLR